MHDDGTLADAVAPTEPGVDTDAPATSDPLIDVDVSLGL